MICMSALMFEIIIIQPTCCYGYKFSLKLGFLCVLTRRISDLRGRGSVFPDLRELVSMKTMYDCDFSCLYFIGGLYNVNFI